VIAAVEGYAVAVALWCDLRIASRSAIFGVYCRRWGVAALPQACLRSDRLSAYEQCGMETADALRNEYRHGIGTISSGETTAGAQRFRDQARGA
jgi:enoyl-CoA hydratase/carnithine racemase